MCIKKELLTEREFWTVKSDCETERAQQPKFILKNQSTCDI